jgi:drug/metabolite transporter (DMT)-like permease
MDLNWTFNGFYGSCFFMSYDWSQKKDALDLTAILVLVLLCVSWGLQQVTVKIANQGISPIWQAGIRSIGSTILLLMWMAARRQRLMEKDGTFWYGIAAGLLFALEFVLIYWGLEFTTASRAVIFLYLSPFVVAIGAQLFIPGENLRLIQVLGLICAFVGIVAAFSESLTLPTYRMLIGDSMLAAAAVFWGATTVLVKASPLAKIAPSKTLLYQLVVSAVVLPLGSIAMGERGIFGITPLIIACLAYQIIWVAFITYLAWFWLIRHYPASRLASFTFLTPLFGVIAGGTLLDEPITRTLLLSLILVGTGIYLVNRPTASPEMSSKS